MYNNTSPNQADTFSHSLAVSARYFLSFAASTTHRSVCLGTRVRRCIYELAYWLRLMKQDRRRKIKLIPIERNASLFRGFPKFQALLGGFALLFAVLVLWSTAWFHKGGPYYTELVPFILLFQGTCCFCVGLAVLWYVRKTTILPARAERRRIVNELRSFKVANTKATVGNDKQVVEDMIATMWKPLAKGDKSKEACLQAFDEEVIALPLYMLRSLSSAKAPSTSRSRAISLD
eukprot:6179246-Pleurochrysis_carterae.AAC.2